MNDIKWLAVIFSFLAMSAHSARADQPTSAPSPAPSGSHFGPPPGAPLGSGVGGPTGAPPRGGPPPAHRRADVGPPDSDCADCRADHTVGPDHDFDRSGFGPKDLEQIGKLATKEAPSSAPSPNPSGVSAPNRAAVDKNAKDANGREGVARNNYGLDSAKSGGGPGDGSFSRDDGPPPSGKGKKRPPSDDSDTGQDDRPGFGGGPGGAQGSGSMLSSIASIITAMSPALLGGINAYSYSRSVSSYYGAYNSYLAQCTTLGIPCSGPSTAAITGGSTAGRSSAYGYGYGSAYGSAYGMGMGSSLYSGYAGYSGYSPYSAYGSAYGTYGSSYGYSPFSSFYTTSTSPLRTF